MSFFRPFQYLEISEISQAVIICYFSWHVIASLWNGKIKDSNSKKITKQKRKFLSCFYRVEANCNRNKQAIVHLSIKHCCCWNDSWHVHVDIYETDKILSDASGDVENLHIWVQHLNEHKQQPETYQIVKASWRSSIILKPYLFASFIK